MLKNYLTVAIRNLLRHKMHSVINILGLAVGMACCVLIFLYMISWRGCIKRTYDEDIFLGV